MLKKNKNIHGKFLIPYMRKLKLNILMGGALFNKWWEIDGHSDKQRSAYT